MNENLCLPQYSEFKENAWAYNLRGGCLEAANTIEQLVFSPEAVGIEIRGELSGVLYDQRKNLREMSLVDEYQLHRDYNPTEISEPIVAVRIAAGEILNIPDENMPHISALLKQRNSPKIDYNLDARMISAEFRGVVGRVFDSAIPRDIYNELSNLIKVNAALGVVYLLLDAKDEAKAAVERIKLNESEFGKEVILFLLQQRNFQQ